MTHLLMDWLSYFIICHFGLYRAIKKKNAVLVAKLLNYWLVTSQIENPYLVPGKMAMSIAKRI
jgi:hypothetical protein